MIYGKKPELKMFEEPPTEAKLRALLVSGLVEMCQEYIDKYKAPWRIENGELFTSYTQGQLFLNQFITVDEETLLLKEDAIKMASTQYEVLITGETGTGKELLAKSMIGNRSGSIKAVNCAGFPRELIESELFGHAKGAFTGADKETVGLLKLANDGVMFLDEIGELPMDVQAKLLRALQEKSIRPVGSKIEEKINCKFVCATNRDIKKENAKEWAENRAGNFRKDLYARISTLELRIKPLSERRCDVIPITESLEGGKKFLEKYREDLENGLLDLSLNVRSLQQLIIRYNVLGRVMSERV